MCATGYFHQVSMARFTLLHDNNRNNKKIYGNTDDSSEDGSSRGKVEDSIHEVNLVVTGDPETGKASLIEKFVKKNCVLYRRGELSHNMLQRRADKDTKRWQRILLHLKDTSTEAQWESSHRSIVHGYMIVFDVTDSDTFLCVPKWCSKIFQNASPVSRVILVGLNDGSKERLISEEQAIDLATSFRLTYQEVDLDSMESISSLFHRMIGRVLSDKPEVQSGNA